MPVYEFKCQSCEKTFEVKQHVDEHRVKLPPCPWCGSNKVETKVSTFFSKTSRKS
jgi:putative FmdB family regulatory protein